MGPAHAHQGWRASHAKAEMTGGGCACLPLRALAALEADTAALLRLQETQR